MVDKALILNKIKNHYGIARDADFAKFLEISPQVLSNWKARSTFDPVIVYTKCLDIDPGWLLTGEGEMLKQGAKNDYTPTNFEGVSVVKDSPGTYSPPSKKAFVPPKQSNFVPPTVPPTAKNVSPTVSPTHEKCLICEEKERVIAGQQEVIQVLRDHVSLLSARVRDLEERYDLKGKKTG